jgi:hypothetical protein
LFISLGRGPVKESGNIILPPGIRFSFPRYKKQGGNAGRAEIFYADRRKPAIAVETDVVGVAKNSLDERAMAIYAKEAARLAAKEVIIREVGKDRDNIVTVLMRLIFMIMEEPDTRSWQTLPAKLSLVRLPLEPGTHKIRVHIAGGVSAEDVELPKIELAPRKRVFYSLRASGGDVLVNGRKEREMDSLSGKLMN